MEANADCQSPPSLASFAEARRVSVVPERADTTRIFSPDFCTMLTSDFRASGLPVDVPPNFRIFMIPPIGGYYIRIKR